MGIDTTTYRRIAFIIACACVLVVQTGCADLSGALARVSAWRESAQGVRSDLQTQLDQLKDQRAAIPDESPDAPIIDAAIAGARAKIRALGAAIAQADLIIEEATNPSDALTGIADSISPWVPAPAQGPLVLGAALIATIMRSRNLKNSAISIIRSIEHTTKRDPEFRDLFARNADTIRTIQTPGARKLIDSIVQKLNKQTMVA